MVVWDYRLKLTLYNNLSATSDKQWSGVPTPAQKKSKNEERRKMSIQEEQFAVNNSNKKMPSSAHLFLPEALGFVQLENIKV